MLHTFSGWYQWCFQDLTQIPELAGAFSFLLLMGQGTDLLLGQGTAQGTVKIVAICRGLNPPQFWPVNFNHSRKKGNACLEGYF